MYHQVFHLHSDLLKALAHPKRLEIVHLLRDQLLYVNQIQEMLGLPQANISQHLQILREAGVVTTKREGKKIGYKLSHPNFIKACDLLREVLINRFQETELAEELVMKMKELVPLVVDPVCKMRLSPKTASYVQRHNNLSHYFCAAGCLAAFKKEPNKYVITQKE